MSRIEAARRRSAGAKRALAVLAAAGMVLAGLLARATHPGHAAAARSTRASSSASTNDNGVIAGSNDFSLGPSASAPQVQTNVS